MRKSSFGFSKPEDSPGFLLWQTTMLWQRLIKTALLPYGISHAQFVIMAAVLFFEEKKQKPIQLAIVEKTKLDKMTVSKSLKKLVREQLIERNEHDSDSRAKSVAPTTKGRRLIKKLIPIIEKIDEKFFSTISLTHQRAFTKHLEKIVTACEKNLSDLMNVASPR